MGATVGFSVPDFDQVPYTVEAVDQNSVVVAIPTGASVALKSDNANAIIVPNSTDPTGATGNVVAAKGFSGSVSGTAVLTNTDGTTMSGTWSGTFTPGAPFSLSVAFGAPSAPSA